jgi:hypothetical protein
MHHTSIDVSKEHAAPTFRFQKQNKKESSMNQYCLIFHPENECYIFLRNVGRLTGLHCYMKQRNATKSVDFSHQANYNNWATPAAGNAMPNFAGGGIAWSEKRIRTADNLSFLDRSHYFLIQVTHLLSSRVWMDPVPDPALPITNGSAGNRTRDL